jgi:hypothetical protein
MGITLDDVLLMVGRLDDTPGFDTARERFRRFISTHITDVRVARAFIEQCQGSLGDQYHRALKDLVTVLGRFLGLETAFGSYMPVSGVVRLDGHWRSPGRLNMVLEVRTDQTHGADFKSLTRSVAAMSASSLLSPSSPSPIGLSVLTTHYPRRAVLEHTMESRKSGAPIKVASIRSLLAIADMVDVGRITHAEVLRILSSDLSVDFIVDLLQRTAPGDEASSTPAEPEDAPAFWVAIVGSDAAATPQQMVERVIGERRVFGLRHSGAPQQVPRPAEQVCFYVSGAGIVGHAQIVSIAENGAGIRGAKRFSHVLQFSAPHLYLSAPIPPSPALQGKLDAEASSTPVIRISEQEFLDLTSRETVTPEPDAKDAALIAADSRSHD